MKYLLWPLTFYPQHWARPRASTTSNRDAGWTSQSVSQSVSIAKFSLMTLNWHLLSSFNPKLISVTPGVTHQPPLATKMISDWMVLKSTGALTGWDEVSWASLATPLARLGVNIRSHWVKMECHQTVKIINKISKLILSLPDKINLTDNGTLLDQPVNLLSILTEALQRPRI